MLGQIYLWSGRSKLYHSRDLQSALNVKLIAYLSEQNSVHLVRRMSTVNSPPPYDLYYVEYTYILSRGASNWTVIHGPLIAGCCNGPSHKASLMCLHF